MKKSLSNHTESKTYIKAITWLERSEYDIKAMLLSDKKTVQIDLLHNKKVIKTEYAMLSITFHEYLQGKILTIYKHFNNETV